MYEKLKFGENSVTLSHEHCEDEILFEINKDNEIEISITNVGKIRTKKGLKAVILLLKEHLKTLKDKP